jgi:hypothetical protein
MATTALGPTLAGGMQPIVKDGYELIYYPDVNNDALQREGKPPVFYWLPNYVHLARKDGKADGDLMISVIRFAGIQSEDTNIGVTGSEQVAGGVLAFTVTSAPPDHVLIESQNQITQLFQGKPDFFWGIRSNQTPIFRPVVILNNITAVSNLSASVDGSVPVPSTNAAAQPGAAPSPNGNAPRTFRNMPVPPMITRQGFLAKNFGKARDSSLDLWYWNMQGQGNGSIDPMGQNAYSALIGTYPTSIIWQSFHGSYTPIFVQQALKIKFWVPVIEITIRGNWDRVFNHFSAAASGRYMWFSGDIKAEFNHMKTNGTVEVEVKIDTTIPGSEQISKYVDEKTNLVFEKFMEQAKKMIFDPPQPEVQAAQASSGGLGIWGVGLSLKYRRDETKLELYYHEKRQMSYLQDHTISSSLEGLSEEIEKNPEAERRYFQTVYMDDWPRKIGRIIKPIANWPKPELNWAGEPVSFMDAQIGYPNTKGELMWTGKTFQKSDPPDTSWNLGMTQKFMEDVENPPAGWKPDVTFVKRTVHMLEPPDPIENPYVRVQIEDNEIELDPENGTPSSDVAIEVRADEAGRIKVGPIALNVELENSKQIVEVTFQAAEESGTPLERFAPVKFSWEYENQETPRFWSVFTADRSVRSFYRYKVRVIVKGSLFTKGMEWETEWINNLGNGPMMISVPTPEDEGVIVKREYRRPAAYVTPTPVGVPAGMPSDVPPPARSRARTTAREEEVEGFKEYTTRTSSGPVHRVIEVKRQTTTMPPGERRSKVSSAETRTPDEVYEQSRYKEV